MPDESEAARNDAAERLEQIAEKVVHAAYAIHHDLGPGLLESVCECLMTHVLTEEGLQVERQKVVPIQYRGAFVGEAVRIDLLVEGRLVVELKSVELPQPVHYKQVLTYLRLLDQPLGLLINFGRATIREGIRRVVNNHLDVRRSQS